MQSTSVSAGILFSRFGQNQQIRAAQYVNGGRVFITAYTGLRLDGQVIGPDNASFYCKIKLAPQNSAVVSTNCTCAMAVDCEHAAALLMRHLRTTREKDFQRASNAAERICENLVVSKDVEIVLARLSSLIHPDVSRVAAPRRTKAPSNRSPRTTLFYVIGATSASRPDIQAISAVKKKDDIFTPGRVIDLTRYTDSYFEQIPHYISNEDLKIAELWETASGRGYRPYDDFKDPEVFSLLFQRILKTGRARLFSIDGPAVGLGEMRPAVLVWDKTKEDKFKLRLLAAHDGRGYPCLPWKFLWYYDVDNAKCGPVDTELNPEAIEAIQALRPLTTRELVGLPLLLKKLGLESVIPMPPDQKPPKVRYKQTERKLQIKTIRSDAPIFDGSNFQGGRGSRLRILALSMRSQRPAAEPIIDTDGNVIVEQPDPLSEGDYVNQLSELGFREIPRNDQSGTSERHFIAPAENWQNLLSKLDELKADGWQVEDETAKALLPKVIEDDDITGNIADGGSQWWFSLELNVDVNGKKTSLLPILSTAIRNLPAAQSMTDAINLLNTDGRFVTLLPDGELISLPFERIKAMLLVLRELLETGADRVPLSLLHAEDLLDLSNATWTGLDKVRTLVAQLRQLTSIRPLQAPPNFCADLRPYQQEGLGWLDFIAEQKFGGILADDMGLGKTVQVLAHLCLQKEKSRLNSPFLVICPTSVLPNWISEAHKFAPHLDVVAYHGANRRMQLMNWKRQTLCSQHIR